jgi:alpha-tubulin suppressor-like RCC1 family protein
VSVLGAVKTFCKIAGGASHTIAIDKNGFAWAWGSNSVGQLGINRTNFTPVRVCNI